MIKIALTAIALTMVSLPALAQMSPVGLWKTIDDETKKEKSLVRITESNGVYSGKIEKFLDPTTKVDAVCDKCTDERKDKPILGMTILRNLKQSADDKAVYDGGDIVDPNNGKVYRSRLKPVDDGKKLEMRGYIGPFYRTQTWLRVE
ncbi:MAG: DUF2147 domain-containing protein [Hydrogenophaga sp.]|jgi:uncharacterized protein (DUF2147 family)|uniref:DUF2147 domain-containing protein n=1 Tax=Hydrogenophaga sp. TaxID=1904254 RepID=UPI001DC6EA33|nr:DUF2147 domain-containing protein [Hydrogenophaga sp.]MBW0169127.1 DUF2147 domain-containing protein [Hydrogenophaga sp.]MBW0183414.1 DUF2147 domain-containing protein [Hydrogenophaga sp.]